MARHKSEFKPARGLSDTGNGHDESGENRIDTGRRHGKSKGARRLPGFAINEGRTAQKTACKRSKKRGRANGEVLHLVRNRVDGGIQSFNFKHEARALSGLPGGTPSGTLDQRSEYRGVETPVELN